MNNLPNTTSFSKLLQKNLSNNLPAVSPNSIPNNSDSYFTITQSQRTPQQFPNIPAITTTTTTNNNNNNINLKIPDLSHNISYILPNNFKSKSNLNIKTNPSSFRYSFSQVKLNQLAADVYQPLSTHNVQELRDGFFDSIYSSRKKSYKRLLNVIHDLDPINCSTNSNPPTNSIKPNKWLDFNLHFNYKKYHLFTKIFKVFIAYFISMTICLIHPSGNWLGPQRTFLPLAMIIHHPYHSFGTQLEISFLSLLGASIGLSISCLSLFIANTNNTVALHSGGILFMFSFLSIYSLSFLRSKFIRFYYLSITSGITILFILSDNVFSSKITINYSNICWNFSIPYLLGILISLLINILVFPDLFHDSLLLSILSSLQSIKNILILSINSKLQSKINQFNNSNTHINSTNPTNINQSHNSSFYHLNDTLQLKSNTDLNTISNTPAKIDNSTLNTDTNYITIIINHLNWSIVQLSENFRAFSNEIIKLSVFDQNSLISIRNGINYIIAPLRAMPYNSILFQGKIQDFSNSDLLNKQHDEFQNIYAASSLQTSNINSPIFSGSATPKLTNYKPQLVLNSNSNSNSNFNLNFNSNNFNLLSSEIFYITVVQNYFKKPAIRLVISMIKIVEFIQILLIKFGKLDINSQQLLNKFTLDSNTNKYLQVPDKDKDQLIETFNKLIKNLKKDITKVDYAYRSFTKTDYFCRDLLQNPKISSSFLFLRYQRQAAKAILLLCSTLLKAIELTKKLTFGWNFLLINYPIKRALNRLSKQCYKDQGIESIFNYYQTKNDVDDAFERIYNLNTSKFSKHSKNQNNKNLNDQKKFNTRLEKIENTDEIFYKNNVRAMDHKDFNFHDTSNYSSKFQYKLAIFFNYFVNKEAKYAFKISFVLAFLCLPGWIYPESWYQNYNCWWCPVLVYIFYNPIIPTNLNKICSRVIICVFGIFLSWVSCVIHSNYLEYKSPYIILLIGSLFVIPMLFRFLLFDHSRSGFIGMITFSIVSLEIYINSENSIGSIWKTSWIIGSCIIISVITSIAMNWILWPFIARNEVRKSFAPLLLFLSQCYQSIADRYLYRDYYDDPTELTFELANIREIRMLQLLYSIKDLIKMFKVQNNHFLIDLYNGEIDGKDNKNLEVEVYIKLINSCNFILEKIIEARMAGIFFHVKISSEDSEANKKLLSLRRDSVASVIFILHIILSCFKTNDEIPIYLPSSISLRKRLFDAIFNELSENFSSDDLNKNEMSDNNEKTDSTDSTNENSETDKNFQNEKLEEYEHVHWSEIHGMAFSKAFTDITEELSNIIQYSKILLGEEELGI
ncbi:Bre4p ASCRUDRAFT_74984 [Ascoidea rubescens DSM 1968]|uniref:DUF2421 domain-containing protein n=1 Tax=Ascoidea rubescens DSM 1968 TaxID=1344418 RepID=A0A1D2VM55_9ASCO|nr:hypothetical protein ASCRUDRAFT_74984 [Ascoidea rubescens DSM 1968]ODV62647.1 hypothetical protein ASCRUDRAFT_74984 [Ascoidea rubescens DSM 1968]